MKDIRALSLATSKYLMDKDPKTWSRAYYQLRIWCANMENGSRESFSPVISKDMKKQSSQFLKN